MEKKHGDAAKWMGLIVVVIGTFMSMLDSSIVNVALPKIMAVFGANLNTAQWVITGYSLTTGAVIPLTGYLTSVFGSKRIFTFSLSLFTIGSFLCGFAGSINIMIFFRIVQAIGGGMIMPVGMSMIMESFSPEERNTAFGFWGIAAMAAPTLGPTLGGFIVQNMDWRLIFIVNVPIGIFGVILANILLKSSGKIVFKKIDIVGFITSTVGLVSLLYILGEWSTIDWNNVIYPIILTLGLGCMVIFLINELGHPDPLLDLRVFRIKSFTLSQVITCVISLALMGGTYILPLFLQNIRGYTAMEAGLIMLPSALAMSFMMPISGKLASKFGTKAVCIPGVLILAYASFQMALAFNMNTSKDALIYYTILRSIGMGMVMMPINTYGLSEITGPDSAKASALSNTVRQVFGAVSVAFITALLQSRMNVNYAELAKQVTPLNPAISSLIQHLQAIYTNMGLSASAAASQAVATIGGLIGRSAYITSMSQATGFMAIIIIIPVVLCFFIHEKKKKPEPIIEKETLPIE